MEELDNIQLLERFLDGSASPEEEARVHAWYQSKGLEGEWDTYYRKRWQEAKGSAIPLEVQQRILTAIQHQIAVSDKQIDRPMVQLWNRWMRYASIIIICISIGVGTGIGYQNLTDNRLDRQLGDEIKTYTVSAEKGQRAKVILPDGSEVWLNSHTTLSYTNKYGLKDRMVSLIGEAFFEVAKDSINRFIVKAGEMEIEAKGTSFNIKAYQEDDDITTTLFTGLVQTSVGAAAYTLSPNQFMSYNRAKNKVSTGLSNDSSRARMWLNNNLTFEGQTMEEIAVMLNRISNVEVAFTSEKVKKLRFTGVIINNSLDNIFELISLTAPITYQSRGDTIVISEKP